MTSPTTDEWAVQAARLVVDEGLGFAQARHKASKALNLPRSRKAPSNEQIEDEVRGHLSIFHAQTQPHALRVMRGVARHWMRRVAALNPYLSQSVWRGTATSESRICIELFANDPKAAEIELLNLGIHHQYCVPGSEVVIFTHDTWNAELDAQTGVDFVVRDADELRGALKPDARGRAWRGDLPAVERLLAADEPDVDGPG